MLKVKTGFLVIISIVLLLAAGCSGTQNESGNRAQGNDVKKISIASAGTGGTFYYIGAAAAEVITKHAENIEATVEATDGGAHNVRLVTDGSSDVGMGTLDSVYFAYIGDTNNLYDKSYTNLRALGAGHDTYSVFITLPRTGLKKLSDLKGSGKSISMGPAGTSAEPEIRAVLEAHGIDLDKDVKLQFLSFNEQIDALRDGSLDVARIGGGIPTAAIADLTSTTEVVFLSPEKEILEQVQQKQPYYTYGIIPAGTYKGQTEDYFSPTQKAVFFADQSMPDEMAYQIVKAIYDHTDELAAIHPAGAEWNLENALKGIEIPVHDGAIKYYKEKGIWKD